MAKHFYCIFLLFASIVSQAQNTFDYTFKIMPEKLWVNLNFVPTSSDSTVFSYGNIHYGGMKDLFKSLKNFNASSKFKIDSSRTDHQITIYHPQKKVVKITYELIDTHKPEQRVVGEMFRPIITHDYFFSLSHSLFLKPELPVDIYDKCEVSVLLSKENSFPLFFSGAPQLKPGEKTKLPLKDGMRALLVGASDLHIETRKLDGVNNYIALRINEKNKSNLDKFMRYFDTFLPTMTSFWGPLPSTNYSLVAMPFIDINYHDISGTAFKNGFHVKYSGNEILATESVLITISHEIVHRYIGAGAINMEGDNEWLNEGFTDYTTWFLVKEAGLISPKRFQEILQETYTALEKNPARNTPNDKIMENFWKDKNYEKLPYHRGALFAAYFSQLIHDNSNGKYSFSDFLKKLLKTAETKNKAITMEDFIEDGSVFLDREILKEVIQKHILLGEMVPHSILKTDL